jgi:hypothetical protein
MTMTVEQRELLVCLFEEAAEVTQIIAKILRFGIDSGHPRDGNNTDRLHTEIGDFLGVVDRLIELRLLNALELEHAADAKLERLENYLLFKGDTALASP